MSYRQTKPFKKIIKGNLGLEKSELTEKKDPKGIKKRQSHNKKGKKDRKRDKARIKSGKKRKNKTIKLYLTPCNTTAT